MQSCLWDLVCRPPVPSEDRGNWGIRIVATFPVCKTHVSLAMM